MDASVNLAEKEKEILAFWDNEKVFEKSVESRRGTGRDYTFYDGPPFATGLPHYGHLLAGTIKDIIPRYWTMKGYCIERRFGWDCHGLPVENEMEKQLALSGKKEIEDFGVDKFNESCRGIVLRYTEQWRETVRRIGRWVDFENDYKTMNPDYMETIWWVFNQLWENDLIYEGYCVQPYCPRCCTPLSNFETNQGYMDREDPSITIKVELSDTPKTFLLVWTTTPWTLPSNAAVAVGEDIDYLKVRDGEECYIIAAARIGQYYKSEDEYEIVERLKGKELLGLRYEPIFDYFREKANEKAFHVYAADYVTTEDGTGLVHQAPAFGELDFNLGRDVGLPVFNPVDEEGKFTQEVPDYQGVWVKEADPQIIKRLKKMGVLIHRGQIKHSYPHCYRCDEPLIYKAISTWFMKIDPIKERMLDNNRKINWVPDHIRDGRFGKWLEGARDWNLSRNRFWGTPIPVWKCACGWQKCVGSIQELSKLSGETITDLHKHFMDDITIPCPQCSMMASRIPEVFDCWFESGSMPYAQNHYPFENREWFEENFPADFIAEGLDQTRGWFYTLLVLSTALFDKPAFKNVIVNGIVLAEDGRKMSKRLKNYPPPDSMFDKYGADALRLFLIDSPVVRAEDLKLSEKGIETILRAVMLPLWNAYSFFVTYVNIDGWRPAKQWEYSSNELDKWILSKLQTLLENINREMDEYSLYKVVSPMVEFIEYLTNWYIRRSRRRFWKSENDSDKKDAYETLYRVLVTFVKALAPFLPYISEEIYRNLVGSVDPDAPCSVHLCDYPQADARVQDTEIEQRMDTARTVAALGRSLRAKSKVRIRQPLSELVVAVTDKTTRTMIADKSDMICEELNVKDVILAEDETEYIRKKAKANFKVLGPKLGKKIKDVAAEIEKLDAKSIAAIESGQTVTVAGAEIAQKDIDIRREEKKHLLVANQGTISVLMNTEITPELKLEGMAREMVNRIQNQRKEADFDVADRIALRANLAGEFRDAFKKHQEYIASEVLASSIELTESPDSTVEFEKEYDIDGTSVWFGVSRV